jgi:hypothetical protein
MSSFRFPSSVSSSALLAAILWLVLGTIGRAHPVPDIPVRSAFETGGACTIAVEVDPRCFDGDPAIAPSMLFSALKTTSEADQVALKESATALVKRCVEFFFEPLGQIQPQFVFEFTSHNRAPLVADSDVVVLTGVWQTKVPAGLTGWRIRATPETKLSVVFQNSINGETHPRLAVLFPKESSFTLDLTALTGARPSAAAAGSVDAQGSSGDVWSTGWSFLKQGFVHVLPLGLDHILFVLGLFLLSRAWRPLLAQVTTFTLAHSVTLALATIGWVKVSPKIVEPIIAASIAAVAIENILRPRYSPWRLLIVFVFGLIHGLGFAGALGELSLPQTSMAAGLVGFNLGVEAGQIAVIGLAFVVTAWIRDPVHYRRWIVIPASAAIAMLGVWWTVERIFGPA